MMKHDPFLDWLLVHLTPYGMMTFQSKYLILSLDYILKVLKRNYEVLNLEYSLCNQKFAPISYEENSQDEVFSS